MLENIKEFAKGFLYVGLLICIVTGTLVVAGVISFSRLITY